VNRRRFLASLAATSLVGLSTPAYAGGQFDVSYLWASERSHALDYLVQLKETLGIEVAVHLEVVLNTNGLYGVVYNLHGGSRQQARRLASEHDRALREAFGGNEALALPITDEGYSRLYNVSYGLGPNFDALKERYGVVSHILGAGVTAALFVEQTDHGNYALVYKRYGDLDSTRTVANQHRRLLSSHGIDASFIQERNNAIVYGATSQGAPVPPDNDASLSSPVVTQSPQIDSNLSDKINDFIQNKRRAGLVSRNEVTSWMVYDLKNDRELAAIHRDKPRQCASMVKPFVALAFFHEVDRGRFVYGPRSNQKFTSMIQHSDNIATDWAIDQVGGPRSVQQILSRNYPQIFRNTSIVERIGRNGKTYQNKASASDYTRFLRAVWRGEVPYASEIRRLLNLPGRDRLYSGAPNIPVGTIVYNKTGSTSRLCGDMGILVCQDKQGGRFPYAIVGIIEKSVRATSFGSWIYKRSEVIRSVSNLTYESLRGPFSLT